jgi:hypothetical protein
VKKSWLVASTDSSCSNIQRHLLLCGHPVCGESGAQFKKVVSECCLLLVVLFVGLARTIYIRCSYGVFGREITQNTVVRCINMVLANLSYLLPRGHLVCAVICYLCVGAACYLWASCVW